MKRRKGSALIDIGEFRSEALEHRTPTAGIYRLQTSEPIVVDEAARTIRYCFSDGTLDRAGDTIEPDGWELDNFVKNPVALWAHDSWSPPIGGARNVGVQGERLIGDVEFAKADDYAFADTIYRLCRAKFIRTVSVGFMPIEWSFAKDKDRPFGIDFEKQELLEISIVPVPCNPNALQEARAKGIDTRPLVAWAEKILDTGEKIILPRAELEAIRRAAQEPRRSPVHRDEADFKCGASRDLSLLERDTWDGPAAAERMLSAAGFDGDNPDSAKARRGFLVYDSGNPTKKGSYKLPFADVVDGELKAISKGISAAKGRLDQAEAPKAVLEEAGAVIAHYEEKMKKAAAGAGEGDPAAGGLLVEDEDQTPVIGNCGRPADEACGMKDPAECAVHAPTELDDNEAGKHVSALLKRYFNMDLPQIRAALLRAGRRLSAKTEAALKTALEHHKAGVAHQKKANESHEAARGEFEKAATAVQGVLDNTDPDEDDDPDADPDPDGAAAGVVNQRKRKVRALRVRV